MEYDRLIGEWLANGRRLPRAGGTPETTVIELVDAYMTFAEGYYRKPDGTPTGEIECLTLALKPLVSLYGRSRAADFGPLALKALRQTMVDSGSCRNYVNANIGRIKRLFKWAVEQELVPPSGHQGLSCVVGLKAGRSGARETEPVRPAAAELIADIESYVSRQVWAMVQLQLLTGARSGEVTSLRPYNIDRGGPIWIYTPMAHKTSYYGHSRTIYIGPKAQQVLAPFLLRSPEAYCFSPAETDAERRASLHEARRTPPSCGNRPGSNRKAKPARCPGDHYDVNAYCMAIRRACDAAFPPPEHLRRQKVPARKGQRWETGAEWKARLGESGRAELKAWQKAHRWHPHQLRHNAATAIRKQFNLEAARAVLGHHSAAVTEIYAEMDSALAASVIGKVG